MGKILNQGDTGTCQLFAIYGAMLHERPELYDEELIAEMKIANTFTTSMRAASQFFIRKGLIAGIRPIDSTLAYKALINRGKAMITGHSFINWKKTGKKPYQMIFDRSLKNQQHEFIRIGRKNKEEYIYQNSWGKNWGDSGKFYGPKHNRYFHRAYVIVWKDEKQAYINAHNALMNRMRGKRVDNDGVYGFQCVDWVKWYVREMGRTWTTYGNAKDYIKKGLGENWKWIAYNGKNAPQCGDIVIWNYGQYGHIAVANNHSNRYLLRVTDQNGGWGRGGGTGRDAIQPRWKSYSGVAGWYTWVGE